MMKQKKIIVPILTLAVMLLMVGGVYAVFSSTQPEKSKAENVRDTTDQDYEKGLTEEQKAFNELINKQIYEETANNLEQYEQYGLTYNSDENQLFFNGKSVCYFADNRATDGTFEGTEVHSANGDIGIITERDRNGNSLFLAVKACFADIIKEVHLKFYHLTHSLDAGRIDCVRLDPLWIFRQHLTALFIECKFNIA